MTTERCFSCRGPRCQSRRRETTTEHGQRFWPGCDLYAGHAGVHRHGHPMDALWVWSDDEAMTEVELIEWHK